MIQNRRTFDILKIWEEKWNNDLLHLPIKRDYTLFIHPLLSYQWQIVLILTP